MRVFLVDDSEQVLQHIRAMLTALPEIEVIGSAADVPEAIQSIKTKRPDVVLLDLHLPSGSGMQVLRMIKNEKLKTITIVLSNYAFPQYRESCAEAGAYAFLDKSTDFMKVPEVLNSLSNPGDHPERPPSAQKLAFQSEPEVKSGFNLNRRRAVH